MDDTASSGRTGCTGEANFEDGAGWVPVQSLSPFVNPHALRAAVPKTVMVDTEGAVVLFGEQYRPSAGGQLPRGVKVEVDRRPDGTLLVRSLAVGDAERRQRAATIAVEQLIVAADEARRAAAAVAANEALNVPAGWLPDVKPVLSGLSARSAGDSVRRGSVIHVRLTADLQDGRLRRRRGEFLCGNREKYANLFSIVDREGEHTLATAAVTCRACLRVTLRWTHR